MAGKPCRYRACGGRHCPPGTCPVAAGIGGKSTSTAAQKAAARASIAKVNTRRAGADVCGFCLGPAAECATGCNAAKAAAPLAQRRQRDLIAGAAKAARRQAAADRRRLAELRNIRPTLDTDALGSIPLVCIKCNSTGPAREFKIAFADDFGYGVCDCVN